MKSIKTCIECKKQTKKTITFGVFPTEDHKWCSEKCLFIWILENNVKVDGELIDEIENRKGHKSFMADLVTPEDIT